MIHRLLSRVLLPLFFSTCAGAAGAWEANYSTDYVASSFASKDQALGIAGEMIRQFNSEAVVRDIKGRKNDITEENAHYLELIASGLLDIQTQSALVNYPDGLRGIRVSVKANASDEIIDKSLDIIMSPSAPSTALSTLRREYDSALIAYTGAVSGITAANNKKQYKALLKQLNATQESINRIRKEAISTLKAQ